MSKSPQENIIFQETLELGEMLQFSGEGSTAVDDDVNFITKNSTNVSLAGNLVNLTEESTTVYNSSFPAPLVAEEERSRHQYVLYIGSGISMLSIMIALFTYTTSRKFRVKRPHMITINLCISLLIFYVGILMTASNTSHEHNAELNRENSTMGGCAAGAVFFELGALYSWTWITVHWAYLTYTVYSVAAPHISHFFIKVTLPAYGFPTILACGLLIGDALSPDIDYIARKTCFFRMDLIVVRVINFLYIAFCLAGITACVTYCIMRLTCRKNKNQVVSTHMRIKMSVIRLAIITTGVLSTSFLELIRWVIGEDAESWFEVFNGAILGTVGIVVAIGLLFRSKEFRIHWVHVLSGKKNRATIVERVLNGFRSRSKRLRGTETNGSFDKSKTLSPGLSSGVTMCESISPPVKMVPRDSPMLTSGNTSELQDVFLFPPVNQNLSSEKLDITDENGNDPRELSTDRRNGNKIIANRNGSIPSARRRDHKDSVPRMSSIRRKVMRVSFRRSSHKQVVASATSPPPVENQVTQEINRQAIEEDMEERHSIESDVDIYRKTSF